MEADRFSLFVLFIERISKNIKRIADVKLEPYGLRSAHLMCILQLAKTDGGLSSTSLADACGVDKAFVSRITSELMEKNYIVKDGDAKGKYKTKFVLTENGEKVKNIIHDIVKECLDHVDSNISAKKLEIFYDVLSKIDIGIESLLKDKE